MNTHLFLIDPIEKLNLKLDSSLRMAEALARRGEAIFAGYCDTFAWRSGEPAPTLEVQMLQFGRELSALKWDERQRISLKNFNCIHMRKDPPYDMDYITTTWFLDQALGHAKILNNPRGLRTVNEKFSILDYRSEIDPTIISADANLLLDFLTETAKGDAVLKPLTLYGGKGVERIILGTTHEENFARRLFREATNEGKTPMMLQKFNPKIFNGEIRCFCFLGKALAWCLKKPKEGQFLANSNFGSTRHRYEPSAEEIAQVERVAEDLFRKHGISVVGFDIIGGRISEINVTSPRLLVGEDDQTDYYAQFAERLLAWMADSKAPAL